MPQGAFGKSQHIQQLQAFIQRKLYLESTTCYMIQELWPSDCNEFQLGHQLIKQGNYHMKKSEFEKYIAEEHS